jgi:hypothetical protein
LAVLAQYAGSIGERGGGAGSEKAGRKERGAGGGAKMGRVWGLGGRGGVKEARGCRRHVIRTGSSEEATEQVVGDLLHLLQSELVREGERA